MSRRPPLPEPDRARLRLLIEQHGETGTATLLGIERRTIARCLAGLPLYPGTYVLVTQRLSALGKDAA